MKQQLLGKFLACLFGMLAGVASLAAFAQTPVPGPVTLRGLGGTIQEFTGPTYGTGGVMTLVPNLGSGGTVTTSGNYTIHRFTSSGTFIAPLGVTSVEVLVVGGGGGGGRGSTSSSGGGGGAGAVVSNSSVAIAPMFGIDITVGDGGAGATTNNAPGTSGELSVFNAAPSFVNSVQVTAAGGGGGGGGDDSGLDGASGGGAGASDNTAGARAGGTGTQGNDGGNDFQSNTSNNRAGGGGGGAGAVGGNGSSGTGGAGGAGTSNSITGAAVTYGGGGGGGDNNGTTGGGGGSGGGGAGGGGNTAATDGTDFLGGGGGGSRNANAGDGGSGVVIVRYLTPANTLRAVHVFTSSGTFTMPDRVSAVSVLVVGGGGGGGYPIDRTGGGGGAGGLIYQNAYAATGSVTVTVGGGGNGGTSGTGATVGSNSVFGSLTAIGGGRGGTGPGGGGVYASTGGSGGGGYHNPSDSGKAGTAGQGYAGGSGFDSTNVSIGFKAGGGGGAGGAGTTATATAGVNGTGGPGLRSNISGNALFYAGGGAGSLQVYAGTVLGGSGVGGNAGTNGVAGSDGTANRGGGGGGGSANTANTTIGNGGNGGSGVVVVTYFPAPTYVVHTFTSNDTFRPPPGVTSVEVLVVGGGGAGGARHGGGGGGGGVVYHPAFTVSSASTYNVVVGAGGTPQFTNPPTNSIGTVGTNGGNSSFGGTITALGGGGGGSYTARAPAGGGSGGGGGGLGPITGGTCDGCAENRNGGAANQGNSGGGTGYGSAGGTGAGPGVTADMTGGGGGGGASGVGLNASGATGGAGGAGFLSDISGSAQYYGGGGGGGSGVGILSPAAGGSGGGGAGGANGGAGTAGTPNTGGGGGGSRSEPTTNAGGAGGSGVVIVRYRPPTMEITQQPVGPAYSGEAITTQPVVRLLTATGAAVVGASVTAGIESGTGTLGGTTTVATNASGNAVFTNLALTGSIGNFMLDFNAVNTSGGETISNAVALDNYLIQITHGGSVGYCGVNTQVTVSVRRANNSLVTTFAGAISLTSSSNDGTYTANSVANTFTDSTPGDGAVNYTFVAGDGGDIVLNYMPSLQNSVTFTATGPNGMTGNSAALTVGPCEIRVVHDGNGTVCSAEDVTVSIVDSNGTLATGFIGTVQLSTSSGQGAWAIGSGAGSLVPGGGDGSASYSFVPGDAGDAVLSLLHPTVDNSVNINAVSGSIAEDDLFVPNFDFVACAAGPSQFALQCSDTSNSVSISVPPASPSSNRLAVATVHRTGALGGGAPTASNVQFGAGGPNMTLLGEAYIDNNNVDSQTQIYGLLDANFPLGTGPFTVTATNTSTTRLCVIVYENIDQTAFTLPPPIVNTLVMDNSGNAITTTLGSVVQTFTSSAPGFTTPAGVTSMDILLVGGGGGGGGYRYGAGGGGAGGVLWYPNRTVNASTNYPIVVGSGGSAGGNTSGTGLGGDGGNTTIATLALTATGGGGGQAGDRTTAGGASDGGSGGGGGSKDSNNNTQTGGNATQSNRPADGIGADGYGNDGANGGGASGTNSNNRGGGGGGAGGTGDSGTGGTGGTARGGNGGIGIDVSGSAGPNSFNFGTGVGVNGLFGGGGGGGKRTGGTGGVGGTNAGAGGAGGGGNAGTGAGNAATPNTGGGGGGAGGDADTTGGAGGSGIALVRYIDPATLTGDALIVSAVSATLNANGTRTWTPLDSDLSSRLFNSNSSSPLTFAVASGYVSNPGGISVTETHNGPASNRRTLALAAFRPAAPQLAGFRITHSGSGGTCAPNTLTITAVDQYGAVLTDYTGTVTLSATDTISATGIGNWGGGSGPGVNGGTPDTNNDGAATYQFQFGDNGVATLTYSRATNGTVNFGVTAGSIVESPFFDANMTVAPCVYRITHANNGGSICAPNIVTIGLYTPGVGGTLMTNFTGTLTLSASGNLGDWGGGTGPGVNNGTANDGAATYQVQSGDYGLATLTYSRTTVGTVNFNVTGGGYSVDPAYDADLQLQTCHFRISHDGNADVCSLEEITISVYNANNVKQTTYTGTVNITTSTTVGDWSASMTAMGTFNNLGSGAANYTFAAGDAGEVKLRLMHHATSAGVSINLNAGSIQESSPTYDPPLAVAGCKIRMSLAAPNATSCTNATLTLGVYNSAGMLATDYTGTVSLTTSTSHGTWLSRTGSGTLVDNNPGNGTGTYTFAAGDGGDAELVFTTANVESVNFDATANSGAILVDTTNSAYDPTLNVTACLPLVSDSACYQSASQANAVTLPSRTLTQGSRMVLLYVGSSSDTDATGATIDGVSMTFLRTETAGSGGSSTKLHVYGILDADLPDSGPVTAAFAGSANGPAMCVVALSGVRQTLPAEGSPATAGQLNGTNLVSSDPISTTLTTNHNNSIILGVTINSQGGTTYSSSLANTLWQAGTAGDPTGADWAGFQGYHLTAGLETVTNDASATPNRQAQIALAVAPFVDAAPAVTGYVPVTLYQTYAGNVNYFATGNTLRTSSAAQCLTTNASDATVVLPANSTVKAAYLYWAGSGYSTTADKEIKFGPASGTLTDFTADQVFIIEPNQVYNPDYDPVPEGFFAAYKDVTGVVADTTTTYRFSDLAVQTGAPWSTYQTCVSGWAVVVVYENSVENLNVINLFHGFQPFWHSSFTLVPRNFRMAKPDEAFDIPSGQITHITFEGDNIDGQPAGCGANGTGTPCDTNFFGNIIQDNLNDLTEVFQLQNDPDTLTFTPLYNNLNTSAPGLSRQYNNTLSYPEYDYSGGNPEFTGYATGNPSSWGTDIDTYHITGATEGDLLYEFGSNEAEQITTRYSTGQDIVLLVGEFISVTNAPIADLEVTVANMGTWKVGSAGTASYQYVVTNNGNGAVTGGFASGDVILTGNMPNGVTIASISATDWDCSLQTTTAFTCVFSIVGAPDVGVVADDELDIGESLPTVNVTVNVGNETFFPLLDNDVTTIARLAHVGDYYAANCQGQNSPAGVQPNPNPAVGCEKAPQFDNVNDLNKFLLDIDDIDEKTGTNNNVHSITHNVRGIETNLSITKSADGILEANEPATYQIVVGNLGPDATTKTITVTDTLPLGLVPVTASGTNWSCPPPYTGRLVTCTRTNAFPILSGGSAPPITIVTAPITAPAVEGAFVSNTATVTAGQYNFDTALGNNSSTVISEVTGPLAASNEKFLLSVTEDGSTIGGLTFDAGDLVVYDPTANTAVMFLDQSTIPNTPTPWNVDALHLLPNGQVIMSTSTDGSVLAGVTFNAEDLVLYDPILETATLLFDGSAIFSADTVDIDAVHVLYNNSYTPSNWQIVLSTSGDATIGALSFQNNDIVSYNMNTSVATLLEDGESNDLFGEASGATGGIGALYIRYNNSNKYVLSTSEDESTISPLSGETQQFERGELIEVDLTTGGNTQTDPLFCDDESPCISLTQPAIFTPESDTRRLDAVHVIESGYFGHFSVSSSGGDTCSATTVTIRKHAGLTHTTETHYRGSIIVSNSLADGTWAKDVTATGTLEPLGMDTGLARYTFGPGDNGQVLLYITGTVPTSNFNVNIRSNVTGLETVTKENAPTEDPNIVIDELISLITYEDEFGAASYSNNNGNAGFASSWAEVNDNSDNPASGKIRINGGELLLNNNGGVTTELIREINFGYTPADPPTLSFLFNMTTTKPSHTLRIEARTDNAASWQTLDTFTNVSSTGTKTYDLDSYIDFSATTQIRFVMTGNTGNTTDAYRIDNLTVSTGTAACDAAGSVDHYAITHDGSMVSCMVEYVTVSPHSGADVVVEPGAGTTITLQTSTNKGFWGPPINGSGTFSSPVTNNGFATYTYLLGEGTLTFPFYYTELSGNSENVVIQVGDNEVPSNTQLENSTLVVAKTGLQFYNETDDSPQFPTLVSGMSSGVYPQDTLVVRAVRASDSDPQVCEAAFDDGVYEIELAFECIDPGTCGGGPEVDVVNEDSDPDRGKIVPVADNGGNDVSGGYKSIPLLFTTADLGAGGRSYSRAQLSMTYPDAGMLQIHGRYRVVGDDDDDLYIAGSSSTFVVRPFGYDIEVSPNAHYGNSTVGSSWAPDANGSVFIPAGTNFSTTVRAVAWDGSDAWELDEDNALRPVLGADLGNNATTPNYGNENVSGQDGITIEASLGAAMDDDAVLGNFEGEDLFVDFINGVTPPQNLRYDEVGIIDLVARLDTEDYLGGGEGISGSLINVGRFRPAGFDVSAPMLTPRPSFPPNTGGPFTYMGEEFTAAFTLTAYNALGTNAQNITKNYFGDFARLTTPAQLSFRAVEDGGSGSDTSLSVRLGQAVGGANPFPANYLANWGTATGTLSLDGNLIFTRLPDESPDGPFGPLKIAVRVQDTDGVVDIGRDVTEDTDACNPDCGADPKQPPSSNLIGLHEFRYGRIRLENGYGSDVPDYYDDDDNENTPEIPLGRDVTVGVVAEYWNGSDFVVNEDDGATPYDSAELDFVAGTYTDNLDDPEPAITATNGHVYEGLTREATANDIPLYLRAPLDPGNDGTVLIELDLDALGLGFLKFNWRSAGEDEDVVTDGDTATDTDNPRALVEFGQFRGNDRIINWQEIFE